VGRLVCSCFWQRAAYRGWINFAALESLMDRRRVLAVRSVRAMVLGKFKQKNGNLKQEKHPRWPLQSCSLFGAGEDDRLGRNILDRRGDSDRNLHCVNLPSRTSPKQKPPAVTARSFFQAEPRQDIGRLPFDGRNAPQVGRSSCGWHASFLTH